MRIPPRRRRLLPRPPGLPSLGLAPPSMDELLAASAAPQPPAGEATVRMRADIDRGVIDVDFGTSVRSISVTPDQCRGLIGMLAAELARFSAPAPAKRDEEEGTDDGPIEKGDDDVVE